MVCEISLRFQAPHTIFIHFHSFKSTTNIQSILPLSTIYQNNHYSLPNKGCGDKYFQDLNRKLCMEKKTLNDSNPPFKKNEKEGGEGRSQLGGQ